MDLSSNSLTLHVNNSLKEPALEQEPPSPSAASQAECGETILLQLLKFKTQLLDVVEELHIRRDAETRFEGQISKLVLEKQELQWEKESLQNQLDSATKQHTSTLSEVKNQFQAKFRSSEEEKGRYQVAAELKDKEMNHLKDELKSLQLLKYNLEKKCSELEQKVSLQSRTKDGHMKQLEEVEKRFSALSRQCAVVKQAHERLEQSVDEAMRINRKLTFASEKQEETIASLKKELEEVHNKLIKARMTSTGNDETRRSQTGREQLLQQLRHRLNLETEMNKKLQEEIDAERADKQDVIRSLQQNQELLLTQTQTVKKAQLELQSQREMFQSRKNRQSDLMNINKNEALKQEHEVVREKSKAAENKVAQVMECLASSKSSWDKEKGEFLDQIEREQEGLRTAREANEKLNQQHTELTSRAELLTRHIKKLEVTNRSQSVSALPNVLLTSVEDVTEKDCFDVLDSEEETSKQQSPCKQTDVVSPCLPTNNGVSSLINGSGTKATESDKLTTKDTNTDAKEEEQSEVFDLVANSSSKDDPGIEEDGSLSTGVAPLALSCSLSGNFNLPAKEEGNQHDWTESETDQVTVNGGEKQDNNNGEEESVNRRHETRGEEEVGTKEETKPTKDKPNGDSEGSARDTVMTNNLETETNDRAGVEFQDEVKEVGTTSETLTSAQTAADRTIKKRHIMQVNDSSDSDQPSAVFEASDCSTSSSDKNTNSSLLTHTLDNKGEGYLTCADEPQTVSEEPTCAVHELEQSTPLLKTAEDKPTDKIMGESTNVVQSMSRTSASMLSTPSEDIGEGEECNANQAETTSYPGFTTTMELTGETGPTCSTEESQTVTKLTEANNKDSDHSPHRSETASDVDSHDKNISRTEMTHVAEPCMTDGCENVTVEVVQFESQVKSGRQEQVGMDDSGKTGAKLSPNDLKLMVSLSSENQDNTQELESLEEAGCSEVSCKKPDQASFHWCSSKVKPQVSYLHQSTQEKPTSEQSSAESGECSDLPLSTIPTFLKSKPSRAPLVIMRASDLLNSSSVCGTAASWRRIQRRMCEGAEAGRGRAATNKEACSVPDVTSSLSVSTCPGRTSKLSWPSILLSDSTSAPGAVLQSDWETSCSQEREDQQSSFRAQISKIEHFLDSERLRFPKRPRTDN